MGYVLVNKQTRIKNRNLPRHGGSYETQAAAKAALTRYRGGRMSLGDDWEVMEYQAYLAQVPTTKVRNLMTGKEIEIAADTPLCCDPSSETYWSM